VTKNFYSQLYGTKTHGKHTHTKSEAEKER